MVLDNYVEVEIEGAKYKLCLNNENIFKAERELASGKLMVALSEPPMAMGDMFVLFKYALIGGNNGGFNQNSYFALFSALNSEIGPIAVFNIILETISKAGILGKNQKAAPRKKA